MGAPLIRFVPRTTKHIPQTSFGVCGFAVFIMKYHNFGARIISFIALTVGLRDNAPLRLAVAVLSFCEKNMKIYPICG